MNLPTKLLIAALMISVVPVAAHAASDNGGMKQRPAHGYMKDRQVEAFKDRREAAYDRGTRVQLERDREVDGNAYGDQPNKLPAHEKYYRDNRGRIIVDRDGVPHFKNRNGR